jgi:hypothetical protein
MQRYTVYFIWKLLCMFQVVPPPIIRSAYNCIYSIWYLSHRYCYLPLSCKSWNRFECVVGGVRHPQHTQTGSNSYTIAVRHSQHTQTGSNSYMIAAGSSNGVTDTRCCRYSGVRHQQHTETCSNTYTIAAGSSNGVINTRCCRYSCMRS